MYEKNKFHFHQLAKNSPLYGHMCILESSIVRIEYARKVLGIILAEDKQSLTTIIEKGWPLIYRRIKQAQSVSVNTIFHEYVSTKNIDSLTTDIMSSANLVILLCAELMDKPISISPKDEELIEFRDTLLEYYTKERHFSFDSLTKEQKAANRHHKKALYALYNKGKKIGLRELHILPGLPSEETFKANLLMFDSEELSVSSLIEPMNLTEYDIEAIISAYTFAKTSPDPEDLLNFLSCAVFIKSLIKLYKETRDYFLSRNSETMALEIETLKQENERLQRELELQKNQNSKLQASYNETQKLLSDEQCGISSMYEGKIRKLEKQVTELEEECLGFKKEIVPLREFVFSSNGSSIETEPIKNIEIDTRGILFGGSEKWTGKLKDKLPKFKFINSENFDMTLLDYAEVVFFNTSYMSHSLYYKVIDYIRKHQIQVFYINNNNVDMAVKQIYKCLSTVI